MAEEETEDMRQEQKEDQRLVLDLLERAFGRKDEAILVDNLRGCEGFIPELSLVSGPGNEVHGHVLFTPVTIEGDGRSYDGLALAPLAVLPRLQGQGIGSSLVRHGLKRCSELGHRVVIVVGDPNYYRRFGFTTAKEHGIGTTMKLSDPYFMALGLEEGALEEVAGIVRYLAPFDDL